MLPIECGLFGICGQNFGTQKQLLNLVLKSLQKLQHRGQDSFGISYLNKKHKLVISKYIGTVIDSIDKVTEQNHNNFEPQSYSKYGLMNVMTMIGHLRYKTSGKKSNNIYQNIQPFVSHDGSYSIAHNGNIKNTSLLHQTLMELNPQISKEEQDELRQRNHDTLYILKILENIPEKSLTDKLIRFINIVPGVYCLLIFIKNSII